MDFILSALFGKKNDTDPRPLHPSTARHVLQFLAHGLNYGANGIKAKYKPIEKVQEFVAVSANLLSALKRHVDDPQSHPTVRVSVHIDGNAKQIVIAEIGTNVMLSLDDSTAFIQLTSLPDLYANLSKDIANHPEIYAGNNVYSPPRIK